MERWLRKGAGKARGRKRGGEWWEGGESRSWKRTGRGCGQRTARRVAEGGEGPAREFPAFAQPHIDPTPV